MSEKLPKRYSASIISQSGIDRGDARDSAIFLAANDAEAWSKALNWATANTLVENDDRIQLTETETGRGVNSSPLKRT